MGHKRRFSRPDVRALLEKTGFAPERMLSLNRAGAVAWGVFGKLLHRRSLSKVTLKVFDKTVWLWRRIDWLMPWPGLSLIAVGRRRAD